MYRFAFPPAINESSCCPASSPTFGVVSNLDFGHSNGCAVVSYCFYNLHFPDDIQCGWSLYMLFCHLYIFFGIFLSLQATMSIHPEATMLERPRGKTTQRYVEMPGSLRCLSLPSQISWRKRGSKDWERNSHSSLPMIPNKQTSKQLYQFLKDDTS